MVTTHSGQLSSFVDRGDWEKVVTETGRWTSSNTIENT